MNDYIFTSESVSEGHPDKICDQISDAIVDAYLAQDPNARVAVETVVTTNRVIIVGEVSSTFEAPPQEMEAIARSVVRDIGYEQNDFHWETFEFQNYVHQQSSDIAQGVGDDGQGAGDQGIMFGYACNENTLFMPMPISCAHQIVKALADGRKSGAIEGLGPDAKSQVSVHYKDGKPSHIDSIVVSTQHAAALSQKDVYDIVVPIVKKTLTEVPITDTTNFIINPSGRFVIGGPVGDAGLTGRKIIVDTYGGAAPHGGGAFSGKDPTKVDRSAAYMARYLAKNIVGAGLADKCTLQLSYAIGLAEPVSVYVKTHGTGRVSDEAISEILMQTADLTPRGIRKALDLNRPIYRPTSAYGHFGRMPEKDTFTWERLDLVQDLQAHLKRAA